MNLSILVISLLGDDVRRAHMSKQLDGLGVKWEFVDGVVGKNLTKYPAEYQSQKRINHYCFDMSAGEIGCFLSHRKVWQECVRRNEICMVLEDDVELLPHFMQNLQTVLSIQNEWDIFRLHSGGYRAPVLREVVNSLQILENLIDPGSAAAFLIKPEAALKLLEFSSKFYMAVDDFIESRWLHNLCILASDPYLIKAGIWDATSYSTINDRSSPKLSISQKIVRELVRIPTGLHRWRWRRQRAAFIASLNKSKGNTVHPNGPTV